MSGNKRHRNKKKERIEEAKKRQQLETQDKKETTKQSRKDDIDTSKYVAAKGHKNKDNKNSKENEQTTPRGTHKATNGTDKIQGHVTAERRKEKNTDTERTQK